VGKEEHHNNGERARHSEVLHGWFREAVTSRREDRPISQDSEETRNEKDTTNLKSIKTVGEGESGEALQKIRASTCGVLN